MKPKLHYAPVTEALNNLRKEGFTIDFSLKGNQLLSPTETFGPDDFEIVDIYRYEGNSDPGDEAVVYAIRSNSGLKGVLVEGYGSSAIDTSFEMIKTLGTPNQS
jgi:hypothetical protein